MSEPPRQKYKVVCYRNAELGRNASENKKRGINYFLYVDVKELWQHKLLFPIKSSMNRKKAFFCILSEGGKTVADEEEYPDEIWALTSGRSVPATV